MYGFPEDQFTAPGSGCSRVPNASMLRRQQWHYDGGALGAAPTKGHVTKTRTLVDASSETWLGYTQTAYDMHGRAVSVTDANGHTTTTQYAPINGNPTSSVVTNHLGHQLTTNYMVERGLPVAQTDANGKTTALVYDGLGRLVQVYRPGEVPFVNNASLRFGYDIDAEKDEPPIIRSRTLVNDTGPVYQDAWVVYDGLLRQRQTQTLSPVSGKVLVQSTKYDSKGHTEWTALPEAVPGTAGSGLLAPADGKPWANQSRPTYDELGRVTRDTFYGVNGAGTAIVERWHTDTTYDFNKSIVDPPVGASTVTTTDAYGRVTSVAEDPGSPSTAHTTSYGYNLAGDLLTVTDPEDNVISYGYDLAGRRVSQDDPDAGDWSYTYDDVGNQRTVTDALSHTITTDYDALNRPTLRHEGATNLASWTYDATGQKGLFDKSTRITPGGNWITDVVGYDARNRPTGTTLTVPAGVPGLSGTYTTSYGYNRADQPTSVTYPAVGGLTGETVNTGYHETLGLPATLTGADTYAGIAFYDDRARPLIFGYGPFGSGQYTLGRTWGYDTDQRLASVSNAAIGPEVARHDMAYDAVGNVTQRTTKLGTNNFRECFTYDPYQRLTRAVTTTTTTACSTNPATPSGSLPYEQDFTHSDDGNLLTRDDGTGPITYSYPSSGSARPHAPTTVGSNTYTWDANGNLDTRTVGGVATDFVFDHEHNLASATSSAGTSEFVYDANGQRLYQKTPTGATLYLEGQEVTATPGGSPTVTATRLYTFAGQLIATRTAAGGVDYTLTDHQGSVEATIDATATTISAQRAYKPYGQPRTTDTFATQRGWIGQIQDPTTNLNYLNARYYDPTIARFISPDPLYNPTQPKSLNPYTYAWSNPTTGSDPSGLRNIIDNSNNPDTCVNCSQPALEGNTDHHNDGGGIGSGGPTAPPIDTLVPILTPATSDAVAPGQEVENQVVLVWDYAYHELDIGQKLADAVAACRNSPALTGIAGLCSAYEHLYELNASGDYSQDEIERRWRGMASIDFTVTEGVTVGISQGALRGDPSYGKSNAEILWAAMALGAGDITKHGGSPRTFVGTMQGTMYDVPGGWQARPANNGKGIVFQRPGATGNADMIRIMEPTSMYPNGYIRVYNQYGQPIDVYGNPGPKSTTHIPQDYQGPWPGWPS
jgi:RHS repeat-associated protein